MTLYVNLSQKPLAEVDPLCQPFANTHSQKLTLFLSHRASTAARRPTVWLESNECLTVSVVVSALRLLVRMVEMVEMVRMVKLVKSQTWRWKLAVLTG